MSEREPSLLRDQAEGSDTAPVRAADAEATAPTRVDDAPTAKEAIAKESGPVVANESGPVAVNESEPIVAKKTTPVVTKDAPPVTAPPASAKGSVAVAAKEATPVTAKEPTRTSSPAIAARESSPPVRPSRREAPTVYVVGFWKRLAAAAIDLAIVIPAALLMTLMASKLGGIPLPPSNLRLLDLDMWIDLVLAADGAVVMGIVLMLAIGMTYLLVFQILVGRTLGMRVLKIKIIDVYGDRPSPARCLARCGGYLASVATLFLGFLWMGVDSEKRGLQDWIAGTYVIRA